MTGRSAATRASATRDTSRGSGPERRRCVGVYWIGSGTSSRRRSVGNSISTGRGRPFFTWVNARRIASTTASGTITCSHHLVTCWKFRNELKFGWMFVMRRG